ncbi:MAG: di-trans,poly-cis-decaprenylcistransferase [Deltaproteobacteria bacterium]|jgi:undecaprenyl diphosphate synthase|nr:di-trans,poly-cis-decaprenylcistransferase [Deltaproteobacteria bacterium]
MDPAEQNNSPNHVGIIMDGNGRWAQARGLGRSEGHRAGAEPVRVILKAAHKHKVRFLTLYTFSTENWSRSDLEVNNLFSLLVEYIDSETLELLRSGVRLVAMGDLDRLPPQALKALRQAEEITSKNTDLVLTLALSYGSRSELTQAAKTLAIDAKESRLDPNSITQHSLLERMWSAKLPDLDLLIRTGGEKRISNFLLWHLAYAELFFTDTLWPDFGEADFLAALNDFKARKRRFGRTD